MKIDDDNLKSAVDISRQALLKPDGAELSSAEKTAMLTVAVSIVYDVHRIADSLTNLTAAVERLGYK